MFYGAGAGKLPTASAVVADVVEAAKNLNRTVMRRWSEKKLGLEPFELTKNAFFVRISGEAQQRQEELEAVFGSFDIVKVVEGEFGILTKEMTEAEYMEKAGKITGILNRIRLAN